MLGRHHCFGPWLGRLTYAPMQRGSTPPATRWRMTGRASSLSAVDQLPLEFTVRDIQRKGWAGLGDREIIMAALDVLMVTNHCREVQFPANGMGRPPLPSYQWNPSLDRSGG